MKQRGSLGGQPETNDAIGSLCGTEEPYKARSETMTTLEPDEAASTQREAASSVDDASAKESLKQESVDDELQSIEYTDDDGDVMCFRLEDGHLIEYCNGRRVTSLGGRVDSSGVVRQLKWSVCKKEGWGGAIADQHDAGGLIPFDAMAKLRKLADKAGVQHNIPDLHSTASSVKPAAPPVQECVSPVRATRMISTGNRLGIMRSPRGQSPSTPGHTQHESFAAWPGQTSIVTSVMAPRARSPSISAQSVVVPTAGTRPVRFSGGPWLRQPQTLHLVRA